MRNVFPFPFFPVRSHRLVLAAVLAGMVTVAGCDSAPGPPDLDASAPVVSGIQVTPDLLALDQIPGSGDDVTTTITVSADVDDEDGDLAAFFVVVRSAEANQAPLATSEQSIPGSGRIQSQIELVIPRASGGPFIVSVFASDVAGHLSNVVFGSINVSASSEPPVIENVDIPAVVTRPAAGEPPLVIPIVATVSDPDGIDNVSFVEVVVNGGTSLRLCDDGGVGSCNTGFGSSGDATAGDGQFTLTIQLDSSNSAATYTFEFSAVDRSGLRSAVEVRTIEVQ